MEDNYKREIDELCVLVKNLQSENKQIKSQLSSTSEKEESPAEKGNCIKPRDLTANSGVVVVREEEFEMLTELRKRSSRQNEQIKDLQRDVENYCGEVENLQNSIEKLIRQNKELLRKNASLQKQGRLLVQERSELLRRIQESEEDNIQLRSILAETSRVCKDLETQQVCCRSGRWLAYVVRCRSRTIILRNSPWQVRALPVSWTLALSL